MPSVSRKYFAQLVAFYAHGALITSVIFPSNAKGLISGTANAEAPPCFLNYSNRWHVGLPIYRHYRHSFRRRVCWECLSLHVEQMSVLMAVARHAVKVFMRYKRRDRHFCYGAISQIAFLAYLNCSSAMFSTILSVSSTQLVFTPGQSATSLVTASTMLPMYEDLQYLAEQKFGFRLPLLTFVFLP